MVRPNPRKMTFLGEHVTGETYYRGEVVFDDLWQMIANKTTQDPAAPQPYGDPLYPLDVLGATWATPTYGLSSSIITGTQYTLTYGLWTLGIKLQTPDISPNVRHEVLGVRNPGSLIEEIAIVVPEFEPTATEAIIPIGVNVQRPNAVLQLLMRTTAIAAQNTWAAPWQYKRQNGTPAGDSGEVWHRTNGQTIVFAQTDSDDTNQRANLDLMNPGDTISGGGITWTIESVNPGADTVEFSVTPNSRASEGDYTFSFTYNGVAPIQYATDTGLLTSETDIKGVVSLDGSLTNRTIVDDAFGVDLRVQQALISSDWDLLSYSG